MTRVWWPPPEFDLQDQLFVYHETASAWFCLLSGLACPVINRFGLGWWVHDLSYPEQLRLSLRAHLDLSLTPPPTRPIGRLFPTPVVESEGSRHVYLACQRLLPRGAQDAEVAAYLTEQTPALARWQEETELLFCRLDFETQQDAIHLVNVEPFPMLDAEPTPLVGQIADQIAGRLA